MFDITLYHYIHCPYCIRIRLALGFLNIDYNSQVLHYSDEETPLKLIGKKILPIVSVNDNFYSESLDIIKLIDKNNKMDTTNTLSNIEQLNSLLSLLSSDIHNLAMPYFIWSYEFNEKDRKYFIKKKSIKRGPFTELKKNKKIYTESLELNLIEIENNLSPFFKSKYLTLRDILIASHLWGMYIVPEFQFSTKIHSYLQNIKILCKFDYHAEYSEI